MKATPMNYQYLINPTVPHSKNRSGSAGASYLDPAWEPSTTSLEKLAGELNVEPADVLRDYLEPFRRLAIERGFMYRNWGKAFANHVRLDWAGLRGVPGAPIIPA